MGLERSARSTQSEWRVDAALALSAAGLCIATFANVLTGDFVYDDTQQILQNPLIQESHFLWQALTTDVWAFSADPVIRFNPQGKVDFYLIGGPGIYHRHVEFTQPSIATFTGFDPFFGVFYPISVPTNQVLLSYDANKFGVNGGGGFNFHVGSGHAKFFAEARYHQIYTNRPTAFIPVTFGFRW